MGWSEIINTTTQKTMENQWIGSAYLRNEMFQCFLEFASSSAVAAIELLCVWIFSCFELKPQTLVHRTSYTHGHVWISMCACWRVNNKLFCLFIIWTEVSLPTTLFTFSCPSNACVREYEQIKNRIQPNWGDFVVVVIVTSSQFADGLSHAWDTMSFCTSVFVSNETNNSFLGDSHIRGRKILRFFIIFLLIFSFSFIVICLSFHIVWMYIVHCTYVSHECLNWNHSVFFFFVHCEWTSPFVYNFGICLIVASRRCHWANEMHTK